MDEFLRSFHKAGDYDSSGVFTMDAQHARAKLRKYQHEDAGAAWLRLFQIPVELGARRIKFGSSDHWTRFTLAFETERPPDLDGLMAVLSDPERPISADLTGWVEVFEAGLFRVARLRVHDRQIVAVADKLLVQEVTPTPGVSVQIWALQPWSEASRRCLSLYSLPIERFDLLQEARITRAQYPPYLENGLDRSGDYLVGGRPHPVRAYVLDEDGFAVPGPKSWMRFSATGWPDWLQSSDWAFAEHCLLEGELGPQPTPVERIPDGHFRLCPAPGYRLYTLPESQVASFVDDSFRYFRCRAHLLVSWNPKLRPQILWVSKGVILEPDPLDSLGPAGDGTHVLYSADGLTLDVSGRRVVRNDVFHERLSHIAKCLEELKASIR